MAFINPQLAYARSAIAKSLAMGIIAPSQAATEMKKAIKIMDKAKSYAFGSTAKFFRLAMKAAFKTNPFGWDANAIFPQWFGKFGGVNVAALVKKNRPKQGRKRVDPPGENKLGGRLPNIIFHSIDESKGTLAVGVIPQKIKGGGGTWEDVFARFQSGGRVEPGARGSYRSMSAYLRGIGIFVGRVPFMIRPARPLIEPLQKQNPPENEYEKRYLFKVQQ